MCNGSELKTLQYLLFHTPTTTLDCSLVLHRWEQATEHVLAIVNIPLSCFAEHAYPGTCEHRPRRSDLGQLAAVQRQQGWV